jgi:hypothetical protein
MRIEKILNGFEHFSLEDNKTENRLVWFFDLLNFALLIFLLIL